MVRVSIASTSCARHFHRLSLSLTLTKIEELQNNGSLPLLFQLVLLILVTIPVTFEIWFPFVFILISFIKKILKANSNPVQCAPRIPEGGVVFLKARECSSLAFCRWNIMVFPQLESSILNNKAWSLSLAPTSIFCTILFLCLVLFCSAVHLCGEEGGQDVKKSVFHPIFNGKGRTVNNEKEKPIFPNVLYFLSYQTMEKWLSFPSSLSILKFLAYQIGS